MEVGAVKQAFNNEVILLKKKLNQAKIQIIHKLTRKAKQLVEKKAPEPLKEKLKRKAESAVKEVLIMKKIKPKDLAKFIVTHKGELKDILNKPTVDSDRACARLSLHKVLQEKYKFIRDRFSHVPIQDLFMSRLERRKIKKEEKEKRQTKKKGKDNKVINSEGDWNVEDIEADNNNKELSNGSSKLDQDDSQSEEESKGNKTEQSDAEDEYDDNAEGTAGETANAHAFADASEEGGSEPEKIGPMTSKIISKVKSVEEPNQLDNKPIITNKNPKKKHKDVNKNKNFNEKLQHRKFKKDLDIPVVGNKIVDPFFITSTGDNYMSVVEPRGPDEIKEEHKHGNRRHRRAVMFGHAPKTKPRYDNTNHRFGQNAFEKGDSVRNNFNNRQEFSDKKSFKNDFSDRKRFNDRSNDDKPEKLHPSWEAKKKKSGILPFEGKKIVFD